MSALIRCMRVACASMLEHEISAACPTDDRGRCLHMSARGWRAVRARVELDIPGAHTTTLFMQSGWLCPQCVATHVPVRQRTLW